MRKRYDLLVIPFLLISFAAGAQDGMIAKMPSGVASGYMASGKENVALFYGKEEVPYLATTISETNHPYYISPDYTQGKLWYNYILYENTGIRYDVLRDEIVIRTNQQGAFNIVLEKEKLQEACVYDGSIIPYTSEWADIPSCNYLILVHGGDFPVVKRIKKTKTKTATIEGALVSYNLQERFYIRKDDICYPVSSLGSLLKLFPEERQALKAYAKAEKLKFGKQRGPAIVSLVKYLEILQK